MAVVDPELVHQGVTGTTARVLLNIPADLEYFDGHFPGAPIVPGVVQVKWAMEHARRCFALSGGCSALEVLKFQRVIRPGAQVTLALEYFERTGKVHFSFECQQGRLSSGRIVLSKSP